MKRYVIERTIPGVGGLNRQQLKEVRTQLRQELNKDFSATTLKCFLKSLVGRGDGCVTT